MARRHAATSPSTAILISLPFFSLRKRPHISKNDISFRFCLAWSNPLHTIKFIPDSESDTLLLLLVSLLTELEFNSTSELRMYLAHEGNRKGNISPSWGQPDTRVHIRTVSRRRARQGPGRWKWNTQLEWVIKPLPHDLVRRMRFWRMKSPEHICTER